MIDSIDHINIVARPGLLAQVRDFYVGILGMEQGPRPAFSSNGYWLYAGSQPLIHLSERENPPPAEHTGQLDHVAFSGNDRSTLLARLQDAGIEFWQNHVPELDLRQVFFRDPAGVKVEINFRGEGNDHGS